MYILCLEDSWGTIENGIAASREQEHISRSKGLFSTQKFVEAQRVSNLVKEISELGKLHWRL
jgi:hypothetical protein